MNFFEAEKMIPAKEENKKRLATRKVLTRVILVSFCSNREERIRAASPDTERNNKKNNEYPLNCSLKKRSAVIRIISSEKKIMDIRLPALSSNPFNKRF